MDVLTWVGIVACLLHSAIFSGLNLALFGISRLRLEIEAESGDETDAARRILALRRDSNFLLTTILWGNVGVNVLLTLLSDSVMTGLAAFCFATFGITFAGEILPQAYFSRNALRMGAFFSPVIRFYQKVLYPVSKPCALLLDAWLGREGIAYLREADLRAFIERHMKADEADLEVREGQGALNFLLLDDLPLSEEGEKVDPESIQPLEVQVDLPVIPPFRNDPDDPFVRAVARSGRKWVILTDGDERPLLVLDADEFLRNALLKQKDFDPYDCCHRPVVVRNPKTPVGRILRRLRVEAMAPEDDVIDEDLILLWADDHRRIITGADLLGRLMRGIVRRELSASEDEAEEETEAETEAS